MLVKQEAVKCKLRIFFKKKQILNKNYCEKREYLLESLSSNFVNTLAPEIWDN